LHHARAGEQYFEKLSEEEMAGKDRKVFSLKNVVALLISVFLSFAAWITITKSDYAKEALLGAIVVFGLSIQAAHVWFGAFEFLGKRGTDN
jgi:hypothetical protein